MSSQFYCNSFFARISYDRFASYVCFISNRLSCSLSYYMPHIRSSFSKPPISSATRYSSHNKTFQIKRKISLSLSRSGTFFYDSIIVVVFVAPAIDCIRLVVHIHAIHRLVQNDWVTPCTHTTTNTFGNEQVIWSVREREGETPSEWRMHTKRLRLPNNNVGSYEICGAWETLWLNFLIYAIPCLHRTESFMWLVARSFVSIRKCKNGCPQRAYYSNFCAIMSVIA